MKTNARTVVSTAIFAAATLGAAILGWAGAAAAAPSGTGSAQDKVNDLQAQGYRVIVNKFGSAPLDHCTLASIRSGRAVTEPATSRDSGSDPTQELRYITVYVDATC